MSRVYAPLSATMVGQLADAERVPLPLAYTVTSALSDAIDGLDEEELEHLATQLAAAACATFPVAVVALEVPPARVVLQPELLAGCSLSDIGMKDVVCFFVSDDIPSEDADLELSWYDASEVTAVREALTAK